MKGTKKIAILTILILSLAILAFTGCAQDNNTQPDNRPDTTEQDNKASEKNNATGDGFAGSYNFGGSTTVEPIALAAIEEFEELYPDAKISYDGTGSSTGIQGVLDGTYSLGAASRDVKEEEKQKGAVAIPVALDGIAVIVNESVDVTDLSLEQLAKIFTGEITNWKECLSSLKFQYPIFYLALIGFLPLSLTRATAFWHSLSALFMLRREH